MVDEYEYKYEISVCTCIKNEAHYIEEFVEHYVNQGIDHFYIVNNGSTDNIEEVIGNMIYKDKITLITDGRDFKVLVNDDSAKGHKQMLDENIYPRIIGETRWAIILDIDEFMHGRNGHTIKTYLSTVEQDIGCIYVIWNIFNPCIDDNGNICKTFSTKKNTKRINHDFMRNLEWLITNANDFGKSIIRTSMISNFKLWLHKIPNYGKTINNYEIVDNQTYCDNCNNIDYSEENFSKVNITLNHYAIRNQSDFKKKKTQLEAVPHKSSFIHGLFKMIELEIDQNLLIEDPLH